VYATLVALLVMIVLNLIMLAEMMLVMIYISNVKVLGG